MTHAAPSVRPKPDRYDERWGMAVLVQHKCACAHQCTTHSYSVQQSATVVCLFHTAGQAKVGLRRRAAAGAAAEWEKAQHFFLPSSCGWLIPQPLTVEKSLLGPLFVVCRVPRV
eukprot:CAMPEP_0174281660 /NCGR_PEP_ID=MMETSP0809-20121228/2050_1 /TAXON_ID=73025 ORGANISM="Eutreptiella gymnastica-like, Strain CCMP1594" /NCGR_SAMPLE_ID=MMETSP0809 /ASSEMBLY_ACC=CAM_ASM_000658 /LENGTH=113 /DNA_ID=CAMNT_0015375339 /DNA_START=1179 /DNA_END=1520 /DNA_ORIENTATION=+